MVLEVITNFLNLKWIIIVSSISLVLLIIIFILYSIEKKLKKKLDTHNQKNNFYKNKLEKLKKSKLTPEQFIDRLNNIAKDFFKEAFNLPYSLEYSELTEEFRKKGKKECITFSELMIETAYSGEKIEKHKLNILTGLFEKIIDKNKIITQEEEKPEEKKEEIGVEEPEKKSSELEKESKQKLKKPSIIKSILKNKKQIKTKSEKLRLKKQDKRTIEMANKSIKEENRKKIKSAKRLIRQLKKIGQDNNAIKKLFTEKRWPEDLVNDLLKKI